MKTTLCRWCDRLATGTVTARAGGLTITIPYCEQHWDNAYQRARNLPARTWKILEQPKALF